MEERADEEIFPGGFLSLHPDGAWAAIAGFAQQPGVNVDLGLKSELARIPSVNWNRSIKAISPRLAVTFTSVLDEECARLSLRGSSLPSLPVSKLDSSDANIERITSLLLAPVWLAGCVLATQKTGKMSGGMNPAESRS